MLTPGLSQGLKGYLGYQGAAALLLAYINYVYVHPHGMQYSNPPVSYH